MVIEPARGIAEKRQNNLHKKNNHPQGDFDSFFRFFYGKVFPQGSQGEQDTGRKQAEPSFSNTAPAGSCPACGRSVEEMGGTFLRKKLHLRCKQGAVLENLL